MVYMKEACCKDWNINIAAIDIACRMAAMNGTPTKFTMLMKYCPYCGKQIEEETDESAR